MLSKLLRTQVPETYKRAHPTGAEQLMDRIKSAFTKRGAKQLVADYRKGCELVAEGKMANGRHANRQPDNRGGIQESQRSKGPRSMSPSMDIPESIYIDKRFPND